MLHSLVDTALSEVRLFMYRAPEHLQDKLDVQAKHADCHRVRAKHPWINLEMALWSMLPNVVWTENPANATFFVVPHSYLGHKCTANAGITKSYIRDGLTPFFRYIYYVEPYFNRSGGRDHVTTWIYENGPLCDCGLRTAMAEDPIVSAMLMAMSKVGYWAHKDADMFGWRPGIDIAMPQYGAVSDSLPPPPTWIEMAAQTKFSFGFAGSFWGDKVGCPASDKHAAPGSLGAYHQCSCSPGVRVWLKQYLGAHCNQTNFTTARCDMVNGGGMGTSWYALCPAGWACWSSRLFHAIDRLVVPVIMANGAIQPFESILDWEKFAMRVNTVPLIAGNTSQLDWLHHTARAAERHCSGCRTCKTCTHHPLVKRVRRLEQVRPWFLYSKTNPYSAIGLFVLELHCRQYYRKNGVGDGTCNRLSYFNDAVTSSDDDE